MIVLEGVSKTYVTTSGRRCVLDNVNVTFESGHNVGILGANGTGKSTLIRLLAGSELPDRGRSQRHPRVSLPLRFCVTFPGSLSPRDNVTCIARAYGAGLPTTIRLV